MRMVKKTPRKYKHVSHNKTHIMLKKGLVVYATLILLFFILIALSTFTVVELSKAVQTYEREQALNALHKELDLGDSYQLDSIDPAPYDEATNSGAISLAYGTDAKRSATFDDLQQRLESIGYTRISTGAPSNLLPADYFRTDTYENSEGTKLAIWIQTDYSRNSFIYGTTADDTEAANEQAPVYVMMNVKFEED